MSVLRPSHPGNPWLIDLLHQTAVLEVRGRTEAELEGKRVTHFPKTKDKHEIRAR